MLTLGTLSLQLAFLISASGCSVGQAIPPWLTPAVARPAPSQASVSSAPVASASEASAASAAFRTAALAPPTEAGAYGPSEKYRFPSNKGFQPPVPTVFQHHPTPGAFQASGAPGAFQVDPTPGAFPAPGAPGAFQVHAILGPAGAVTARTSWRWPLIPRPAVIRSFDPPAQPWLSGHRGVDLAASPGSDVLAPAAGAVTFAGWVVDRPVLTITHPDGLRSSFEPVQTSLTPGTIVAPGEAIGVVAASGHCAPADCLHWGVRRGADYIDPLRFVTDRRPSVLLPLNPP